MPRVDESETESDQMGDLRKHLPPELRHYTDAPLGYNGLSYEADYLSPSLLVEIKRARNIANLLQTGRNGMMHLQTLSRVVATMLAETEQPPKLVLILVIEAVSFDKSMLRLMAEADLFNIDVAFMPTVAEAARLIQQIESSTVSA